MFGPFARGAPFHSSTSAQRLCLFEGFWIGSGELYAGALCSEHPFDASAASISLSFPLGDFGFEDFAVVDASVEALGAQDADLDLDHVEPRGMLGRVMELQAAQDAMRLGRGEGFVEGPRGMRRQIVEHDADPLGLGIMKVHEITHAFGEVARGAAVGDLDRAPRLVGIEEDEEVGGAVATILAVVALELAWRGRDRLAGPTRPGGGGRPEPTH